MNRDEFANTVDLFGNCVCNGGYADEKRLRMFILAEYDRLTALNKQRLEACKAARRHLTEDGVQDFDQIIIQLRAAIRAAEGEEHA